jgi:DNA repair protein RadA/Sms
MALSEVAAAMDHQRLATSIGELDRVLGGGLVPGSITMLGGEPGVGKSTLLLQVAAALGTREQPALIVAAEESPSQIGLRAERLQVSGDTVSLTTERSVEGIAATAADIDPTVVVVDSIQTVTSEAVAGAAGGVSQVRESAAQLVELGKRSGIPILLVGHVTKDGSIAGPKLVEHMVDVVLALEGEADGDLRLLRALKNRFGSINQMGVFEMGEAGLVEMADPSEVLAGARRFTAPGSVLFPAIDGKRSLLVEIQALTVPTKSPQPRRSVKGLPPARVHQVLAVLYRHCRLRLSDQEVYVSVMAGARIEEPAVDLAVAVALASSLTGTPLGSTAAWGEVGLTGELRSSPQRDRRLGEVERLGIEMALVPGPEVSTLAEALTTVGLADSARAPLRVV